MYGILFDHIRDYVPRLHHLHLQELLLPLSIEACILALEEPNGEVENVMSNSKRYTYQTELFRKDGTPITKQFIYMSKFGLPTISANSEYVVSTSITKIIDNTTGKVVSAYLSDKVLSTIIRLALLRKNTEQINHMVMHILVQNILVLKQHILDDNMMMCDIMQSMFGGRWVVNANPFEEGNGIQLLQMQAIAMLPFLGGDKVKRGMVIALSPKEFITVEDCKFFEQEIR